jgi:hypothetical protein
VWQLIIYAAGVGHTGKGFLNKASAKVLLDAFGLFLRLIAGAVSCIEVVFMSTGFKGLITLSCLKVSLRLSRDM